MAEHRLTRRKKQKQAGGLRVGGLFRSLFFHIRFCGAKMTPSKYTQRFFSAMKKPIYHLGFKVAQHLENYQGGCRPEAEPLPAWKREGVLKFDRGTFRNALFTAYICDAMEHMLCTCHPHALGFKVAQQQETKQKQVGGLRVGGLFRSLFFHIRFCGAKMTP